MKTPTNDDEREKQKIREFSDEHLMLFPISKFIRYRACACLNMVAADAEIKLTLIFYDHRK